MTILLRPATADDLMAVGALHYRSRVAAYRGLVDEALLTAPPAESMGRWWAERWSYERDTHELTVAERHGTLVGFTYVGPEEQASSSGELCAIHLDPAEQGRGTGRALMIDALDRLHRRGYDHAVLWVIMTNRHARGFYEQGGWRPDGARRASDFGPEAPLVRYARRLP